MFVLISEAMVSEIRAMHLDLLARAKFTADGQSVKEARSMIAEMYQSTDVDRELSPKELEQQLAEARLQRMREEAIAQQRSIDIDDVG